MMKKSDKYKFKVVTYQGKKDWDQRIIKIMNYGGFLQFQIQKIPEIAFSTTSFDAFYDYF